jgi:hypothetical protein
MKPATPNDRCIRDPLCEYLKQIKKHLENQHYSRDGMIQYSRCINALGCQMKAFNVDLNDLDEERAVDLISESDQPPYRCKHDRFVVKSFVKFLKTLGVAKSPRGAEPGGTGRCHRLPVHRAAVTRKVQPAWARSSHS